MRSSLTLAAVMLAFALGGRVPVAAQEATPGTAGEAVDPGECRVGAPTVESLGQLLGTPAAPLEEATPEMAGSPGPFTRPQGPAADPATVEAITATYRELVACLNGGDLLRPFALYTEGYIRRNISPEQVQSFRATPVPQEPVQVAFRGVREAVVLPDGRVGALIDLANPTTGEQTTLFAVLAQVGDRWLIDEETVIEVQAPGTPVS